MDKKRFSPIDSNPTKIFLYRKKWYVSYEGRFLVYRGENLRGNTELELRENVLKYCTIPVVKAYVLSSIPTK